MSDRAGSGPATLWQPRDGFERADTLVHREDRDASQVLQELFHDEGIAVRTGTHVERVEGRSGESVRLHTTRGEASRIEGSDLLVATGRTPNTDGIGLEAAGVERDERGFVKVDERLRTTAPGVWAVGDCAGSPFFTHIGDDDVRVVRDNLAGIDRVTTGRLVPFCLFTDPELARIGLSESEARSRGIVYRLAKIPMAAFIRPWTLSEPPGFYKTLVAADSDRILGFTAFGRGRRGHDDRSISDDRRPALHGVARCDPGPPDDGGRARHAFPRVARQALTQSTDTY